MVDSVEQQNIRTLDIDKAVKGFALTEYVFKNYVTVSSTDGDSIRWYQETAADLTATAPTVVANISPLSKFPTLEVTWTRNTSYVRKYAAECFISMEDIRSCDIDVLARQILRLTRAVVKQVDTRIYNVLTESQTPVNINTAASTAAWDAGSGQDPILDILKAKQVLNEQNYNPEGAVLALSPKDHKSLLAWLISTKGASIPNYSSGQMEKGVAMSILGLNVIVSNNVVADSAAVFVPKVAATWKTLVDTTARVIEEAGMGSRVRVWEIGECLLTDPKAVYLITNTQT